MFKPAPIAIKEIPVIINAADNPNIVNIDGSNIFDNTAKPINDNVTIPIAYAICNNDDGSSKDNPANKPPIAIAIITRLPANAIIVNGSTFATFNIANAPTIDNKNPDMLAATAIMFSILTSFKSIIAPTNSVIASIIEMIPATTVLPFPVFNLDIAMNIKPNTPIKPIIAIEEFFNDSGSIKDNPANVPANININTDNDIINESIDADLFSPSPP